MKNNVNNVPTHEVCVRQFSNSEKKPSKLTINSSDYIVLKGPSFIAGSFGKICVGLSIDPKRQTEHRICALKVCHLQDHQKIKNGQSTIQSLVLDAILEEAAYLQYMQPDAQVEVLIDNHKKRIYIKMPLMCGSLFDILKNNDLRYAEKEQISFSMLYQVSEDLCRLHKRDLVHCDVKPPNILFNEKGRIVLADFGLVKKAHSAKMRGSNRYIAPERYQDKHYDQKCDIWALGVSLLQLLINQSLFIVPSDKMRPTEKDMYYRHHHASYKQWYHTKFINNNIPNHIDQYHRFDKVFSLAYQASPTLALFCFKYLLHPDAPQRFTADKIVTYLNVHHANMLNAENTSHMMQKILRYFKQNHALYQYQSKIAESLLEVANVLPLVGLLFMVLLQ